MKKPPVIYLLMKAVGHCDAYPILASISKKKLEREQKKLILRHKKLRQISKQFSQEVDASNLIGPELDELWTACLDRHIAKNKLTKDEGFKVADYYYNPENDTWFIRKVKKV